MILQPSSHAAVRHWQAPRPFPSTPWRRATLHRNSDRQHRSAPCVTVTALSTQDGLAAAIEWSQRGLMTAAAALPGLHPVAQAAAARGLPLLDLVTALQPSCFDAACQRQKDALLVASLLAPLLIFGAAAAYLLRPPPQASLDDGSLFQDSSTGAVFEAQQGTVPERDRRGELAFRAVSYTPWPVEEGAEGERLRIPQGTVGQLQPRTFVFSRVLPQPSQLVMVTLERPLGIIFEEDVRRKRAVVVGFTPGGHAEQQAKRARLNTASVAALEGDVLRACTATNIAQPQQNILEGHGSGLCRELDIGSRHSIQSLLGHGAFGIVVQAQNRETGAMVAIKLLSRGSYFSASASVYEVYLTPQHLAISMEFADAGSLLTYLQKQPQKRLPEATARWLFQQLVIGLAYTHHRGVANRDLKLENLLLCSNGADAARPLLKIGDFGYSKHDFNSSARTRCGTEVYMAPEVVCCTGKYDAKKADVWSIGVILYIMLAGGFPWTPGDNDCLQNIIAANYLIPLGVSISPAGLDMLSHLLCADPDQRWSTEQIQQHPWFQQDLPEGARGMNDFYISSAPSVDQAAQAAQLIADILERAAAPGEADEPLMSCRFAVPTLAAPAGETL
ncbi:Serine/threonine-protein kinase SAPK9 [Chlorella vulgaris]